MRQAGRYLPEYRELKERHDFLTMVRTPELAAEVSLQPLRRFALDAAIVFSDILVVPEALGQGYSFREGGGIAMDFVLNRAAQIAALAVDAVPERLDYVAQALRLVRAALGEKTALLGFAGSPWTLATYMVEGGSVGEGVNIRALAAEEPELFKALMGKLSESLVTYLNMQIAAGADAVQIFDSWGGLCTEQNYDALSLRWIRRVIAGLPKNFPVIVYAKGMNHCAREIAETGARVVSLDWTCRLSAVKAVVGKDVALQGNLDPAVLTTTPENVRGKARQVLQDMRKTPGHIFNLGHGITPDAKLENVETLVQTVTGWRNDVV